MEEIMTMMGKKIVTIPTVNDMEDVDIVVERKLEDYVLMGRITIMMERLIVKTAIVYRILGHGGCVGEKAEA
jgi:hypothetical protein